MSKVKHLCTMLSIVSILFSVTIKRGIAAPQPSDGRGGCMVGIYRYAGEHGTTVDFVLTPGRYADGLRVTWEIDGAIFDAGALNSTSYYDITEAKSSYIEVADKSGRVRCSKVYSAEW